MRETSFKMIGGLAFIGILGFAIYYPYKFFGWMWLLDFSGPTSWQVFYFVENSVEVPFSARLIHFLTWLPVAISTQIALLAALYLLWRVYRQAYFEKRTVTALQVAGIAAAFGAAWNMIAGAFEGWALTRFNDGDQLPIAFRFDSGEMGVLLTGVGLFLLGWVVRLAMAKHLENSEMV